jgi:hypothetical protein
LKDNAHNKKAKNSIQSGIQETSHTITSEDVKNGVTIPIFSEGDNFLVGAVTFPKGILPKVTLERRLNIANSNREPL